MPPAPKIIGTVAPRRPSIGYALALIVVAMAMVALPLLYAALVVGLAVATGYHAVTNVDILSGAGMSGRLLVYLIPIVAGGAAVFAMLKPFLARPAAPARPEPLDPASEPELFRFIEEVARAVDAPLPERVVVDLDANASAGFHSDTSGLLGHEHVLTLGLPLVATLRTGELASVLAHEFGHFTQRSGVRASMLIRGINNWFYRVAHQRDSWDEALDRAARDADDKSGQAEILIAIARAAMWAVRKLLAGIMLLGHALSCVLMRQLEHDADRVSRELAGGETAASTLLTLPLVSLATSASMRSAYASWEQRRELPADFAGRVAAQLAELPEEARAGIQQATLSAKAGLFSTHPSIGARVQRLRADPAPGLLRSDVPATELFRDFEGVSRRTSLAHYRSTFAPEADESALVGRAVTTRRAEQEDRAAAIHRRYFRIPGGSPLPIYPPRPGAAPITRAGGLTAVRTELQALDGELMPAYGALFQARARRDSAHAALALLEVGLGVDAGSFGLESPTAAAAHTAVERAEAELAHPPAAVQRHVDLVRQRIALALAETASAPGGTEERAALDASLSALARLEDLAPRIRRASMRAVRLGSFVGNADGRDGERRFQHGMRMESLRLRRELHGLRAELVEALGSTPPWPEIPKRQQRRALAQVAARLEQRIEDEHERLLARVAEIAEGIEGRLGLPPLPDPTPDDADAVAA